MDGEIFIEHQTGCARCDADGHDDLTFKPLTNSVLLYAAYEATHWCPCPANGEPILMATFSADNLKEVQ